MNRPLLIGVGLTLSHAAIAKPKPSAPPAPPVVVAEPSAPVPAVPAGPDRTHAPDVAAPAPFVHPQAVRLVERPGLIVDFVRVPEALDVELDVTWRLGVRGLSEQGGRHAAEAMATLWDVATTTRGPAEVAATEAAGDLDVVSTYTDDITQLSLTVPKGQLTEGLTLFEDVLLHPGFPKGELKRFIQDTEDELLAHAPSNLRAVFSYAWTHAWAPVGSPDDQRPDLGALAAVRQDDLHALHRSLLEGAPVHAWITGDLSEEAARAAFADLSWWAAVGVDQPVRAPAVKVHLPADAVLAVDLPTATQAIVGTVRNAPARTDADRPAFAHASYALVGPFLSRLNRNLREDKGWTYGVGGSYAPDRFDGSWSARGTYTASNIAGVLREMDAEIAALGGSGPTAAEIDANIREQVTAFNDAMLDAGSAMSFYAAGVPFDETIADAAKRVEALRGVTPEQAAEVASRWFADDAPRLILVVGRRADVEPQLAAAGLTATWVSASDAVLGKFDAVTVAQPITAPTTP